MTTSCVAVDMVVDVHVDVCDECLVIHHVIFRGFHPLTTVDVQRRTIFYFIFNLIIILRNYLPRVRRVTKNLSWISKNIQSGATTCKLLLALLTAQETFLNSSVS